jgi:transglutaminase-like putative cysteine protease
MRFEIRHVLKYRYTRPVFIEPLTVRLGPREDAFQKLGFFEIKVDPVPAGSSVVVDIDGQSATQIWFNGLHDHMTVTVTSRVSVDREHPLNFILPESAVLLPMDYDASLRHVLSPYLWLMSPGDPEVDEMAKRITDDVEGNTVGFITELCQEIHKTHKTIVREEDGPWPPARTLWEKKGACRDLSLLYMDVCRRVGIASRFVSGYVANRAPDGMRYLHAWVEVYLPGAGWRGFDPSTGNPVGSDYVVVAGAAYPELAAPTSGYFRGTGADSKLEYELEIDVTP